MTEVKEILRDVGEFCYDHGKNLLTLFVGATLCGFAVVVTYFLVRRLIYIPMSIDWDDSLRIGVIVTAVVIGIRIAKISDYTERLFRRY